MQNQPSLNADYPSLKIVIPHHFRKKYKNQGLLSEINNPNRTIKSSSVRAIEILLNFVIQEVLNQWNIDLRF